MYEKINERKAITIRHIHSIILPENHTEKTESKQGNNKK